MRPRRICPVCHREVSVRKDGQIQFHKNRVQGPRGGKFGGHRTEVCAGGGDRLWKPAPSVIR